MIWATITTLTPTTYRVGSQSGVSGGYNFRGLLLSAPQIEGRAKVGDQGAPVREVALSIDNSGGHLAVATDELWGATVQIAVDGVTEVWAGKVRAWSQDGRGVLSITAVEDALAVFSRLLPDEVVRLGTYSDATREATNTVVPTVFGGAAADPVRVKGLWVDRVNFRCLLCSGEIRSVEAVLKDRVAITTGFTAYTGTSGQATYPGFAYIEFAADPRDSAGRWPEILADVVGLKLGGSSEAECRNPARVLQYLLTTAATGACGWGLGVAAGDLDAASWAQAITDCDSVGFKADGAINTQRPASWWIDQLLRAMRGELTIEGGKWFLRIDKVRSSSKTFTEANMRLEQVGKGAASERINRVCVDYRYDITDGTLLGSAQRDDATSQTAIGINERRHQLLLVRDHTAGNLIADYLANVETYGEQRLRFATADACAGLKAGDVVTVTRADLGLSGAKFRITAIRPGDFETLIEGRGYDDAIFGTSAPSSTTDPATDPALPGGTASEAPPAVASSLNLSTGLVQQSDGTSIGYIEATWTNGARTLYADVEIGEGASPGTWRALGATQAESIHVDGLKIGQLYTVRVTCRNAGGSSSTVTASATISADTTPPGKPVTPTAEVIFKSVRVKCFQNASKAADMAGFKVFRHTSNNSGAATEIGWVACGGTEDGVVLLDQGTAYGATYYYWTKAVDRTGNASAFSDPAGPVTTAQVVGADVANGAINASALFAAGVVDATALGTGSVIAAKIAAGAVTASALYVAAPGAALNKDPHFEDASAWCSSGTICTITGGKIGSKALVCGPGGGAVMECAFFPIDITKKYRLRFWAKSSVGSDRQTFGRMYFFGESCGSIGDCYCQVGAYAAPPTTWTECYGIVTPPSNARYAKIYIWPAYSGTTGENCVQDARIEEAIPGTLIQDGAISTDKLAANSVVAGKVCAGAICTCHLATAGISADCITAGTLDAICICGVCLYACSGTVGGICMTHEKLWAGTDYGAGAVATVYMGALAGGQLHIGTYYGTGSGNFAVTIGRCLHHPQVAWCAMDGILVADNNLGVLFKVGRYHADGSAVAQIAGYSFSATTMTAGSGACGVGMHAGTTCPAFWAGCDTGGSATFRVYRDGCAVAGNMTLTNSPGLHAVSNKYAIIGCANYGTVGVADRGCFGVWAWACCAYGVYGCTQGNYGVFGVAASSIGVYGLSAIAGVYGWADNCIGVCGRAVNAYAVAGNTAYYCSSSRYLKVHRRRVDVLDDVRRLPIERWVYHDRNARGFVESIGPYAEDVASVFGFAPDNHLMSSLDGVALRAVQELDTCITDQRGCIAALEDRLALVEKRMAA